VHSIMVIGCGLDVDCGMDKWMRLAGVGVEC